MNASGSGVGPWPAALGALAKIWIPRDIWSCNHSRVSPRATCCRSDSLAEASASSTARRATAAARSAANVARKAKTSARTSAPERMWMGRCAMPQCQHCGGIARTLGGDIADGERLTPHGLARLDPRRLHQSTSLPKSSATTCSGNPPATLAPAHRLRHPP